MKASRLTWMGVAVAVAACGGGQTGPASADAQIPPVERADGGADAGQGAPGADGSAPAGLDGGDEGSDAGAPASTCIVPDPPPAPPDDQAPWSYPPLQPCLQEYELRMTDAELETFIQNPLSPEIPAQFVAGGVIHTGMVRLRGASARYFPKKSWNVDLGSGRFENRRRFNLVAEYQDQTLMVEKLAYDMLAAMGVPAPRTKFVRLRVNGRYEGVFLDIEQVDKHFARANGAFQDFDPTIYRCGWKDCEMKTWKVPYQGGWNKRSNESEPSTDIERLMEVLNHTPEPDFAQVVGGQLELEHYLRSMATDVLISNNFIEDSESYMVHDRVRGKWSYVPWDLNNADPRWWHTYPLESVGRPIYNHTLFPFTLTDQVVESRYQKRSPDYEGYLPVFSNLGTRIVFNPELRARLEALVARGRAELFTEAVAHARIDAMYELIAPHMLGPDPDHTDPYFDREKLQLGPDYLKLYVTRRNPFIDCELARLRQPAPLRLHAVNPAEGWVEIENVGPAQVQLGGRTLTNNLRQAMLGNLPDMALGPGEVARFDMAALGVPLSPAGEVGIFSGERMTGVYDLLFYGPASGGQNVHFRDCAGRWQVR